jgi:hypothetical protein
MLAAIINATTPAGAIRLTPRGWGTAARVTAWTTILFIIHGNWGCHNRGRGCTLSLKRGLTCFFFRLQAGSFSCLFFSTTIVFGAAALFLAIGFARLFFPATRFFQRGKAGFFCLAQQLGLQFLARQLGLWRTRRGRRRRSLSDGLWCDRGRFRLRGGRGRRGLCRLLSFAFAWFPQNAATLYFHHNGVRPPMAEALLDLAGFHRPLDSKRCAHAQLRFVV